MKFFFNTDNLGDLNAEEFPQTTNQWFIVHGCFFAGSSSALAQDKLSIGGYSGALTDLPALVAQSEDFFKANGLAVEMIDFASGSMAVAALQGGSVDVISNSGTNQQIVNGNTGSVNKRLVQIYSQYPGATWNLVVGKNVVVDPSGDLKKTLLNLKGKTIGIPVVGSEGHAIAGYLFKYAGLNSNTDVSYIGVGVGPQAVSSFQAGQIDAVIVIPPVDALLRSRGGRTVLALRRFVWKPTSIIGPDSRAVWTVMGGCRERWS